MSHVRLLKSRHDIILKFCTEPCSHNLYDWYSKVHMMEPQWKAEDY